LNLRQSGVCTLGRLIYAHQRVGVYSVSANQDRGWLGSSAKLSYRPQEKSRVKQIY